MKYLITGGCGFVGSNIAAELIERGEPVTVFDNMARNGTAANLAWLRSLGAVEFVHGDTRNRFDVEELLRQQEPEVIFHLAGQVAMTTSMRSPRKDFEINVLGSINLLEAAREFTPKAAIVYASSNKVYGTLPLLNLVEDATRYRPYPAAAGVDESAPLEFHTPYGCSKGAADQYMLDYARGFGLNTVVFRHSTIYGGRQYSTFDQGWVGWFCRQALEQRAHPGRPRFTISGDGKQVRDLLHVSDAVRCYLAAAEHIAEARGEAFNIGGGEENSMSLLELFAFLEERLSVKLEYDRLPWRHSDQKYFVANNAKATRLLGWQPLTGKADGIQTVLHWEEKTGAGFFN
ncbi:MAG: NAD-dependent epimerase/dehydratase family protein [Acidobacteriota bacterium]|nr:NAD-dependent epimerase/dehydratase family protein [Acidobacteriota bacterium]